MTIRLPLGLAVLLLGSPPAPPGPAPAPEEEERSTGLPGKGHWTFNLDAALGAFGFANSLYTNVRPDPSGNLGDNWVESFVKPAISASFGVGESELYGKLSAVGERTFAAPPSLVGEEASSFQVEDPTWAGARERRWELREPSRASPWAGRSTRSGTGSSSGTAAARGAAAGASGATPARPGSSRRSAA